MIITICGSMQFHKEMGETKRALEAMGHTVYIPKYADDESKNESYMESDEERIILKIEHDLIRDHFRLVEIADAVLILNHDKKGIPGYIGGNTFLEMGIAFRLDKKIFLLNDVPMMDYLTEMHAMKPVVIHGDLTKIG